MAVLPSYYINLIAKVVADDMIESGYWADCTAEKIIEQADTYEELTKWYLYALKKKSPDGVVNVSVLPSNPKEDDVAYVDYGEYTYRYMYHKGHWKYIEARQLGTF